MGIPHDDELLSFEQALELLREYFPDMTAMDLLILTAAGELTPYDADGNKVNLFENAMEKNHAMPKTLN